MISENCLTRACWFSRCKDGVISSEHISVRIWGTTKAEKQNKYKRVFIDFFGDSKKRYLPIMRSNEKIMWSIKQTLLNLAILYEINNKNRKL